MYKFLTSLVLAIGLLSTPVYATHYGVKHFDVMGTQNLEASETTVEHRMKYLSQASVDASKTYSFEGVYVGGQIGYSVINADSFFFTEDNEVSFTGFGGGGFVGYGYVFDALYYLGIEGEVGYDGADLELISADLMFVFSASIMKFFFESCGTIHRI